MKIRDAVIASAAIALAAAACTDEAVQPSRDCASLLAQFDQAAPAASPEELSVAEEARENGEELCLEGKSEQGVAQLDAAISQISDGSPDTVDSQT